MGYYVLGQSLARHTSGHTGIHMLWHTIRVCEGVGNKVVGMQLHVYIVSYPDPP